MTKQLKLSALVAAMLVSASAFAAKPGYTVDQTTDAVTRNSYGECWHTAYFDKATEGLVECGDKEAPKPVAAVEQPKMVVVTEKVTISSEVLFNFDKATLRPDATKELDPLVERFKQGGVNLQSVEIDGYTDWVGSDKYNLALSQKRADTVKNYLVSHGVPAEKLTAVGKGKADAKFTEQCKGKKFKNKAARNECSAGDRRVELQINTLKENTQPAK